MRLETSKTRSRRSERSRYDRRCDPVLRLRHHPPELQRNARTQQSAGGSSIEFEANAPRRSTANEHQSRQRGTDEGKAESRRDTKGKGQTGEKEENGGSGS